MPRESVCDYYSWRAKSPDLAVCSPYLASRTRRGMRRLSLSRIYCLLVLLPPVGYMISISYFQGRVATLVAAVAAGGRTRTPPRAHADAPPPSRHRRRSPDPARRPGTRCAPPPAHTRLVLSTVTVARRGFTLTVGRTVCQHRSSYLAHVSGSSILLSSCVELEDHVRRERAGVEGVRV